MTSIPAAGNTTYYWMKMLIFCVVTENKVNAKTPYQELKRSDCEISTFHELFLQFVGTRYISSNSNLLSSGISLIIHQSF